MIYMKQKHVFFIILCIHLLAIDLHSQKIELDPEFGEEGIKIIDLNGEEDFGWSIAVQNDEKIVMGGFSFNGNNNDFALVRLDPNGELDTEFGINGIVLTDFSNSDDRAYTVLVQDDQKILLVGDSNAENSEFRFNIALARYNPDGSLDETIGDGGKVIEHFNKSLNSNDTGRSALLQNDGKIVVGSGTFTGEGQFILMRFNSNGILDKSFGVGGKVGTSVVGLQDVIEEIVLQKDNKLLAIGRANLGWYK